MGTQGRRGLEKFFLGSTTERLLRTLPVPLLTIRGIKTQTATPGIRNILVTTDLSDGTPEPVAYALSIAQERKAKVTLLHVLNDVEAEISGRYRDQLLRSIRHELEDLLLSWTRKSCEVAVRVVTGRPIRRILPLLNKEKFDLIVMNIHGKTLLDRMTIGSTAEKIVRAAPVPVLVIPPRTVAKPKSRVASKAA